MPADLLLLLRPRAHLLYSVVGLEMTPTADATKPRLNERGSERVSDGEEKKNYKKKLKKLQIWQIWRSKQDGIWPCRAPRLGDVIRASSQGLCRADSVSLWRCNARSVPLAPIH
ncbi:hypothetical protein LY76DRAFT_587160 [Colletotrichum caudatum]|nr:hypothetical protein LY76DRAFT_587160 [Colletotrichum caudatum]